MKADVSPTSTSNRVIAIAGASVAGVRCATALRDQGFQGELVLLDSEEGSPYDKPQLSKRIHTGDELNLIVEKSVLVERGITFCPGVTATGLDVDARVLETSQGSVTFDELIIATGCRPKPLPHPLPARAGYVRTRQDWERLKDAVQRGGHLLVVGGGFLGLEAAAAATCLGMKVTVVDVAPRILTRGIPEAAAAVIASRHAAEGVDFRLSEQNPMLDGDDHLVWIDGTQGHYALASIGAVPNVEWLAGSRLTIDDGVVCGDGLAVAPGVWAVGDCARWVNPRYDRLERHEHWTTAVRHAQHVAKSIVTGTSAPMVEVPYVWSDQFDLKIQSVGRIGTEELHFVSESGGHVVVSATDDRVSGVTTINAQALCLKSRQLLKTDDPAVHRVIDTLGLADFTHVS
ncbi:FAD-dependent oxidoreductase [Rhodococcus sp. IEGM 1307]|uniref:NAD(P)/FAD-dependent oxidoreductase n=1 Tax=Rhodococcus sp. IEGM 1307 TaxID=3047091 RepID=UPI0024B789C1|nr:FAD-dependent oxidoreductase [Rhodococcus sp. IEGM 1307]